MRGVMTLSQIVIPLYRLFEHNFSETPFLGSFSINPPKSAILGRASCGTLNRAGRRIANIDAGSDP